MTKAVLAKKLINMVKRLLLQNNYDVITAYSGSEALLILEKEIFDLVLLDLMLLGISGETVLMKIREKADIDSRVSLPKQEPCRGHHLSALPSKCA